MKSKLIKTLCCLFIVGSLSNINVQADQTTYTVKSGDSLWKISQNYNTTVDSILKLNNLSSNDYIYPGQALIVNNTAISNVETTNYTIQPYDNLWDISQKFNTTMDTILKSNMLSSYTLMPGQILTIPINSTEIVKPIGITMMKKRATNKYGDLYTWENARRIFTVDTIATLIDIETGIFFNIKYYGGSNHSDIIPLTTYDTQKMKQLYPTWSWSHKRPMVLHFKQGGTGYQLAVSVTGMPHSTTNIYDNGVDGHFDMYFYNSTSHVNNTQSSQHQSNIITANGY